MTSIFKNAECTMFPAGDILEGSSTSSLLDILVNPLCCQEDIIKKLRLLPYGCDQQKALKVRLTAATFSSVQKPNVRAERHHIKHSGFIQFDIDGKDNPAMLEENGIAEMKAKIISIPFTAYCGLSASGKGLWGLFKIKNEKLHMEHFEAMERSFKAWGITIDRKPKNVASLRFIAFDPDAYFNHQAKTFDLIYTAPVKEKKELKKNEDGSNDNSESKILLTRFNTECEFDLVNDILINAGWQYWKTKGDKICYTRPGKKSGNSGDYLLTKRTFTTFSSAAPGINWMKENDSGTWSASPITLLLNYECGGSWAKVFAYIKSYL